MIPNTDKKCPILFKFYFYNGTTTNGWTYQLKVGEFLAGWNLVNMPKADFTIVNSGDWTQPFQRIWFTTAAKAGKTVNASFDGLYYGALGIPMVLFTYDDAYASAYTEAYTYMKQYGMRGTHFVTTDWVDDPTNITHEQLQEMYAYGWDICNHTTDHTDLTTLTEAQQETMLAAATAQLDAWGFTRSSKYVAYPGGTWNTNTMTAMANLGMLAGRAVVPYAGGGRVPMLPPYHIYQLEGQQLGTPSGIDLATSLAAVDDAIAQKTNLIFFSHDIGAVNQVTVADHRALVDYVFIKARQGFIYVGTINDYYKLTQGSWAVRRI